ncbi:MAG TPA: SUMF1/EgtB/PvdO family nonheme iron enzyme [Tepidisphaeraceae bacterium]|jgi:formylglycine-generating enzyme required for sulfatase activity|nr:SUMF1/EgtB/PvdO family nonheme iron enzyme [Tepidisphaeraceae bacterium]
MSKIGNYEILDELSVTQTGSVSRAERADGEPGTFAVKRFCVPVDDPSEPNWELQTFLDRARVQQTLAAGGAKHWAAIHDLGIDVDTAWYVTDYLPLTAQKLVDAGVAIKSDAMIAIVFGVLQGLSELKALRNRVHGNLKPQNVLIAGTNLGTATVQLTDPATNGQAAKVGDAGDIRAVGELIHALVVHCLPPLNEWEVPPSAPWTALGPKGPAWRKLCSDLLNPDPALRLKLPAIAQRLGELRTRKKHGFRKFVAAAAVLAVLAGAGVGVLSMLDRDARAQYSQSKRIWFGKFLDAAADPAHRKRWDNDPDLKAVLDQLPVNDLRAIDGDDSRLIRWKYSDYTNVRNANLLVAGVQSDLPGHWKRLARAEELRRRLDARGWAQPAQYLANLLDEIRPIGGSDITPGIDKLLEVSPHIEAGLAMADSDWKQFNDRLATAETMHDPVLTALAEALRKSASSEVKLDDKGFTGLDEIKHDAAVAGQIADAIRDSWPTNVDKDAFDRDVAKTMDVKNIKKGDAAKWVALVSYHAFRHEEATAAAAQLRKRLNETITLIDRAHVSTDEASAFKSASGEATFAIAEFERFPFTRRTIDDGTFARKRDEVSNRIESLRRFYHPEAPDQWLAALPGVSTGSEKINSYWETWRGVLKDGLPEMMKDHAVFASRQQASEQMRALLVSLDQAFPPAPPIANESFMAAAKLHREQSIDKLLPLIDLRDPKLDGDALRKSTDAFTQWTSNLLALSKDFPITKELINYKDRPDLQWKTAKPEFWNDPVVQTLVKEDMLRIGRMTALEKDSREELIKAMIEGGSAEVALEAWRLVGTDSVRPPWPAKAGELTAELKFRQRLTRAFKELKNPSEADVPLQEMATQGPIRWRRFVENATTEAMLAEAWSQRDGFGVDSPFADLTPVARYNLSLEVLHQALAGGEEKEIRQGLSDFSTATAAVKDHPEISDLPGRISRVDVAEAFADRSPGDLFSLTLAGAQPIQFKRLEPKGTRPFYLCTTDVSVSQFVGVMDTAHAWQQAKYLPWPVEEGKPDTRRGPRTWEWGGATGSPMTSPLLWLTPEEYNDYPQAFRAGRFNRMALSDQLGGNPSGEHPIQYLSADVALYYAAECGCRLPTAAEWQAAYATEKSVPMSRWNLRDQTWETQRRYVAAGGGSRWPDEGIYPIGSTLTAVGRSATSRPENDGALFFQLVSASGGLVFHHLVGNVAQFVCEASDAFDQLKEKKTAAAIRKFIEDSPRSIDVIGGSALSPPELAIDKPQPVAHAEDAYADVGIRLAFTAPARTLAEKVKWVVGTPPFIFPQAKAVEAKAVEAKADGK